ncbi:hypothetical protein WKK05_36470 (plasmid) [Nostoc sp. UHCC 0302]|uniref:hypothetical protein n=1 Tax=Nostoc sp. UHCC 0302 TaxID=3134896 RepID=UPI00311CB39A
MINRTWRQTRFSELINIETRKAIEEKQLEYSKVFYLNSHLAPRRIDVILLLSKNLKPLI